MENKEISRFACSFLFNYSESNELISLEQTYRTQPNTIGQVMFAPNAEVLRKVCPEFLRRQDNVILKIMLALNKTEEINYLMTLCSAEELKLILSKEYIF